MARVSGSDDHFTFRDNQWQTVVNDIASLKVGANDINAVMPIVSASLSVVVLSASTAQTTLAAKQHFTVADATSANFGVVLPGVAVSVGQSYTVKKIDVSANSVFLSGASTDTIQGTATLELNSAEESVTVTSDGQLWHITGFYSGNLGV